MGLFPCLVISGHRLSRARTCQLRTRYYQLKIRQPRYTIKYSALFCTVCFLSFSKLNYCVFPPIKFFPLMHVSQPSARRPLYARLYFSSNCSFFSSQHTSTPCIYYAWWLVLGVLGTWVIKIIFKICSGQKIRECFRLRLLLFSSFLKLTSN